MRYKHRFDLLEVFISLGYRRPKTADPKEVDAYLDAYLRHLYEIRKFSTHQISDMIGITYHPVRDHLVSMGVKMRPRGGSNHYIHGRNSRRKGL